MVTYGRRAWVLVLLLGLAWVGALCRPVAGQSAPDTLSGEATVEAVLDALEDEGENLDGEAAVLLLEDAEAPVRSARNPLRINLLYRVGRRVEQGPGYHPATDRTTYAGSPYRQYVRLRLRLRNAWSANLTLEKDPGEAWLWTPRRRTFGFDHTSAHLAYLGAGRVRTVIVGDYIASFGQGLVLWRPAGFGKGREPTGPLVRRGRGLQPYGSTEENRFLRGLAVAVDIAPGLTASAFASRRSLDGRPGADEDAPAIRTTSGLHRTPTERVRRDALREDLIGGHVGWARGRVQVGVTGYTGHLHAVPQEVHPHVGPLGMIGMHARLEGRRVYGFAEAARAPDARLATLAGVGMRMGRAADLLVLARRYPAGFESAHGHAFGDGNGRTADERGVYVGLDCRLSARWRLAAYVDHFRLPGPRPGTPRPAGGQDGRVVVEFRPRRWITIYAQGRSTRREGRTVGTSNAGVPVEAVSPSTRHAVRLHLDYTFSPALRIQQRVEVVRAGEDNGDVASGIILYQDIHWRPFDRLRLDVRASVFDADGYEARLFVYERDLPLTLSVPSFSGRGQRWYGLIRWDLTPSLTLAARVSATRYEDVQTVGSGLDEVQGNRVRDLRAALHWHL